MNLNIGVLGNRRDAAPLFEVTTASGKHAVGTVMERPEEVEGSPSPRHAGWVSRGAKADKADTE